MITKKNLTNKCKGVTLIEVVLDAAILSALATIVLISLLASVKTVTQSSIKATAAQLANEQIETLRNYSYNDLATQNGAIFPPGVIADELSVIKDKKNFIIYTDIRYVDDPFDGQAGESDDDLNPADYKRITVTIKQPSSEEIVATLSTDVASRAAETDSDTGVLRITVIDATGLGVPSAQVSITNTISVPNVNIQIDTDINGTIFIPNLPPSTNYHVSATKSSYSTDFTSPISLENPSPTNPDPTVLLQQVTPVTLAIDHTAALNIIGHNLGGSSIDVDIVGSKIIGNTPILYKNTYSRTIGSETLELQDIEFDSYSIVPPAGWYIKSCNPILPANVAPEGTSEINCYFTSDALDPRISTITPQDSPAVTNVEFEITGANLFNNSFFLSRDSFPDIIYNNLTTTVEGDSLTGTLDFSPLSIGSYDLVFQDLLGHEVRQNNAITIK